jgi:MoxR-like ATPase
VVPDDVQRLVRPVLAHRLLLTPEAAMGGRRAEQVLDSIVAAVPVPKSGADADRGR